MSFARWKRATHQVWHSDIDESLLPRRVRKRHQWLHQHIKYDRYRISLSKSEAEKKRLRGYIAQHKRDIAKIHHKYAPAGHNPNAPKATHQFFQHGVASGDALSDQVVLWTRLTPTADATPASGRGPVATGTWQVSRNNTFSVIVRSGVFTTSAERDHTIKIDAAGLTPNTTYFYRFIWQGPWRDAQISPVGRTKTAPAPTALPTSIRFGVLSCANWQAGWFSAYRHMETRNDIDAIVFLGDYIYEYANGGYGLGYEDVDVRPHNPAHKILSQSDYRLRHAQYKSDPDLQRLHAKHPWYCTWDDHEIDDNYYATGSTGDGAAEDLPNFAEQQHNARKAYDEWMPVRLGGTTAIDDDYTIYRRFQFGQLAELSLLDLRTYRDEQIAVTPAGMGAVDGAVNDPARTITGQAQMDWLKNGLKPTAPQWRLVGNPVMIMPVTVAQLPAAQQELLGSIAGPATAPQVTVFTDSWDGYTPDRKELLGHIVDQGVRDVVFLTGDIHTSWAGDVPYPPENSETYALMGGTAGVEFVGPSVTSNNIKDKVPTDPSGGQTAGITAGDALATSITVANQHIKWTDLNNHGFMVVDITPARVQADWWYIASRTDKNAAISWGQSWATNTGTGMVHNVTTPLPGGPNA